MNNTVPRTDSCSVIKAAVKDVWQKLRLQSKIVL